LAAASDGMPDDEVARRLSQMESARKGRDFKTSDAIRAELAAAGIIVEQTKAGIRWKRK
jgi:cysteinyl-tRNA synthetase